MNELVAPGFWFCMMPAAVLPLALIFITFSLLACFIFVPSYKTIFK